MTQNEVKRIPYCKRHEDCRVYQKERSSLSLWGKNKQFSYYCDRCKKYLEDYEVRFALSLHCHHCGNDCEVPDIGSWVECPKCHAQWLVKSPHVCHHLPQPAVEEAENLIIYPSKITMFSPDATIVSPAGTDVVAVAGTSCRSITTLNPSPFLRDSKTNPVNATIFYVRQQINHIFPCGTRNPIYVWNPSHSEQGEVRCAADVRVRVLDAERFLREMDFKRCTLDDLRKGTDTLQGLDSRLFEHFTGCCADAAQRVIDENNISPLNLQHNLHKMQAYLAAELDKYLNTCGMRVDSIVFQSFTVSPHMVIDILQDRVENLVSWEADPIRVHEKDNPDYYEMIKLGGKGQIRLQNRNKLLNTGEGKRWADPSTDDKQARETLCADISRQVYAIFTELLQNMIDQTGVSLDSIPSFLTYLQNTVQSFLNDESGILGDRGLSIQDISMEVKAVQKCQALLERASVDKEIRIEEERDRLRKYTEGITIVREKDASKIRIEKAAIKSSETEQIYDYEKKELDIARKKEADQLEFEKARLLNEAKLKSTAQTIANDLQAEQERQKHNLALQQQSFDDQDADHDKKRSMESELETYRHAYAVWQEKHHLEEAQRLARERELEAKLDAELRDKQKISGVERSEALSDTRLKQAIADIMRSIQESDLSMQQKLDTYAHLKEITELDDQFRLGEQKGRLEITLSQLRERGKLDIAKENAELADAMDERLQNRRERALQAEFLRTLDEKRLNLAHEIELMKLQQEKEKLQLEIENRSTSQQRELDKLLLILSHLEKLNDSNVTRDIEQIRAKVAEAHEICDALKVTTQLANDERREQRADDSRAQEREADRIERIYREVLDLEHQRMEMQASAPLVFEFLREEEPKVKAPVSSGKEQISEEQIQKMFDYVRSLKNDVNKIRKEVASPKPVETHVVYESHNPQPSYHNPSSEIQYCPFCGNHVPAYASFCPHCNHRIR